MPLLIYFKKRKKGIGQDVVTRFKQLCSSPVEKKLHLVIWSKSLQYLYLPSCHHGKVWNINKTKCIFLNTYVWNVIIIFTGH